MKKVQAVVLSLFLCAGINPQASASPAASFSLSTRYYDAPQGRFISPDAVVPNANDPQSLNRYSYVKNNPVVLTDPSGHLAWVPILIAAAVYAGASGTVAAINGGNGSQIWTATWQGAIQGLGFGLGTAAGGPILGGIVAGGLGGAMNGGGLHGTLQGGAIGGITAGFSSAVPIPQNVYGAAAARVATGAVIGGGLLEMSGGSFRQGATQGALTAAVSMAYGGAANRFLRQQDQSIADLQRQKALAQLQGRKDLFHYTSENKVDLILSKGMLQKENGFIYLTDRSDLTPLQAQIDLSLPPSNTAEAVFQVDYSSLDPQKIISLRTATGNFFGRAGGGIEIIYDGDIPKEFLQQFPTNK